jgi:hypothetical protein
MKLTRKYFLFWAITTLPFISFAQLPCGTEDPISSKRFSQEVLENEWQDLNSGSRQMTRTFMIAVHIIRSTTGTLGISEGDVLDAIEIMNTLYEPANIQFEICSPINYIDDNTYLETTTIEGQNLVSNYNLPNFINIYFIPKVLNPSGEALCGNASLPNNFTTNRRIFVANSCAKNGSTLSHEMGHFFGLLHTHSTTGGLEYVERINCQTRGDGFCDTPADPELGSDNVLNCQYIGGEYDPVGVRYMPDPSNLMSYAPKSCRTRFTPQQFAYMNLISKDDNNYLSEACDLADLSLATSMPDVINLDDFSSMDFNFSVIANNVQKPQKVQFKVSVIDNQTNIEKAIQTFTLDFNNGSITFPFSSSINMLVYQQDIINANMITFKIDTKDEMQELNEHNNSLSFTLNHNYAKNKTSLIFPNPTTEYITFYLTNDKIAQFQASIVDITGKLVMQAVIDKQNRNFIQKIDVSELKQGMYFLIVELDSKTKEVQKFVKL